MREIAKLLRLAVVWVMGLGLAAPAWAQRPSVTAYNLFDYRYGDPGGEELVQAVVVQDQRVVRLGMRYQF